MAEDTGKRTPEGVPILEGPDGLAELDNPMPRWMWGVFIVTIVWSAAYVVAYPGVGLSVLGWTQKGEYDAEVAADQARFAAAPKPAAAAGGAAGAAGDPAKGKALFEAQCAACHGAGGTGAIGPNLTDADWLYGGTPAAIAKTVTSGTAKGMPPFGSSLKPDQVADLAAYVHGLGGSPGGGK